MWMEWSKLLINLQLSTRTEDSGCCEQFATVGIYLVLHENVPFTPL